MAQHISISGCVFSIRKMFQYSAALLLFAGRFYMWLSFVCLCVSAFLFLNVALVFCECSGPPQIE